MKVMANLSMGYFSGVGVVATLLLFPPQLLRAQDLSPRAYLITPLHSNAVTLTWSFYDGSIDFNGALPVSDATGNIQRADLQLLPLVRPLWPLRQHRRRVALRSRQLSGNACGAEQHLYRSGLVDSVYRFSVNLKGGPAMPPREFVEMAAEAPAGRRV